jgi:superfamily I DNA and/or RNA helicase
VIFLKNNNAAEFNEPMISSIDELIKILTRENRYSRSSDFLWSNVDYAVQKDLLYKIAEELGLTNPRFIASKELEKHKYKFLNDSALNGLYSYYKNRFPRKPGVHVMKNVCDCLEIEPTKNEDWITYIQRNNIFSWKNTPIEVQQNILLQASYELGYKHPIFITNDDFNKKFKFLNNKTLSGFYTYFLKLNSDIRGSVIKNMCLTLNIKIEEKIWVDYITSDKINTFWDVVPKEVVRNLLLNAANSMGYSNPRMMCSQDMKKELEFLNGMSFYSFISRFFKINRNGLRSIDYICDTYNIPTLTYEEWLFLLRNSSNVRWQLIPKEYIGEIITEFALEMNKANPRMLKYEDLKQCSKFLNGKNLASLYVYYGKLKGEDDFQIINYICNITGIPHLTSDQWFEIFTDAGKIFWELVPKDVLKDLLLSASKELELKNPRLMGYNDFCNIRFEFLKGKTLSGLYYHMSAKYSEDYYNTSKYIFDYVGIDKLSLTDWITSIGSVPVCRWESIPPRVQRNIVIRASQEMKKSHPRLMANKDFYTFRLSFLNNKTLSGFHQYYANIMEDKNQKITDFIFNKLNIPKIDLNIKTGRLATIDSSKHRKYYDSIANQKDFINSYLNIYSLESLCKKYTTIKNAKEAGIYKKGLATLFAPLNKSQYLDFIYEALKSVPRDTLNLRKLPKKDYRLLKSDLFTIAGIKEPFTTNKSKINFAKPEYIEELDAITVIQWLNNYRDLLNIRIKYYNIVSCSFKDKSGFNLLFNTLVPFAPGDIITDSHQWDFQVLECTENKTMEGYILELKPLLNLSDEDISLVRNFNKSSNDDILLEFLDSIVEDIMRDSLSDLMSITLGLKKQVPINENTIKYLEDKDYFNETLINNTAQKQAVALACSLDGKDNTLAIVQGPPGTGKTTLIKEIALQYYNKGKNVLVLAKTNVAADNVLQKIIVDKVRVVRTGNNIETKSTLSFAPLVSTSNSLYMTNLINKNIIAVGTPLGFYLDINKEELSYDIVIIDEASQLDVPETLFAMQFAKNCVMIGDHMQIPPFPIQEEVLVDYDANIDLRKKEELQQSLFEKLITDLHRFNHVFLDINYRTENPELVSLISNLVYDGKLAPNLDSEYYTLPESKRKKLFPKEAIDIVDTSKIVDQEARMETEINSTYYNLSEAMMSVKKVIELLKQGERLESICIITPYKAQVEKLKEVFIGNVKYFTSIKSSFEKFIESNIYTIDSFQGREQDNVIINWVRSNHSTTDERTQTGFLRDYRRVNVALSRAKKRLILIGDFTTLLNSDNLKVRYIFNKLTSFNKSKKIVL